MSTSTSTNSRAGRRSGRKRKREVTDDTPQLSADEGPTTSKSRRSAKRKKGKLSEITELPYDVLFSIFSHLEPLDLLKVARTTKAFRSLLFDRSSVSVWKSSMAQVEGLPEMPEGWSEPAWVNLCFDPYCHFCFTTGVRNIEWMFLKRICGKCAKLKFYECNASYLRELTPPLSKRAQFMALVPHKTDRHFRAFALSEEVENIKSQYESLPEDEKLDFIKGREDFLRDWKQFVTVCQNWSDGRQLARSEQLDQIRDERYEAIVKKLEALGYAEEVKECRFLSSHKGVRDPKPLTDRIWKNMAPGLIKLMEETRTSRLKRLHEELVISRKEFAIDILRTWKISQLPFDNTDALPHAADFCEFKEVKEILEQPLGVEVTLSSFDGVVTEMSNIVEAWQKFQHTEFIRLHQTYLQKPDSPTTSSLSVVSAYGASPLNVFKCIRCSDVLFYPTLLSHPCLGRLKSRFGISMFASLLHRFDTKTKSDKSKMLENDGNGYRGERTALSLQALDEYHNARDVAKNVIHLAGLEEKKATVDEMDEKDMLFACEYCAKTVEGREGYARSVVFGWKGAIRHHTIAQRHFSKGPAFHVLNSEQKAEVKSLFAERVSEEDAECWSCVHCMELPNQTDLSTLEKIKSHLKDKHEIENPENNTDFYKDTAKLDGYEPYDTIEPIPMELEMDVKELGPYRSSLETSLFASMMPFGIFDSDDDWMYDYSDEEDYYF